MEKIFMPYGTSSQETQDLSEMASNSYFAHLQELANSHGLSCFSLNAELARTKSNITLKATTKESKRPESIPLVVWNEKNLRTAGAFYSELIYPLLAKGKDAYKPTDQEVYQFCNKLFLGEAVNIIQYYTFSKTQSPRRTGSPNHIIDLAEIEMLKHYSIITKIAQEYQYELGFVIVDENDIFPRDEFVGGNEGDSVVNKLVVANTLKHFGTTDKVAIRSLYDSVVAVLGENFNKLYEPNFKMFLGKAYQEMMKGEQTPLVIRMHTFLNVISNRGLGSFGLTPEMISEIQMNGKSFNINKLPIKLLNYLMTLTAHVATIMSLRDEAAKKVSASGKISEFPEYDPSAKLYGGVTRSLNRWGFLPNPKKYRGKTINPMHGLAVYSELKEYRGVATYQELSDLETENNAEIIRLENKPIFAVVKETKEQKGERIYDSQTMNLLLINTFNNLNLNHGHMAESVAKIKDILLLNDLTDATPPSSKLILVGGGSGTAVAGRSLFKAGISNFTMLANTGEMGRDQQTGETMGGGMIFEEIAEAIDVADILKQSVHATPEELRGNIHHLLNQRRHPHMRFGYLVLEALRQIKGDSQKAVDFLNNWMNNPYRVIPSTVDKTELFLDLHGHEVSSNEYARRADPYEIADRTVMRPTATLNKHAKEAIEQASTIIIGPGDVFFSVLPHWGIRGFQTALIENSQANIILIVNLTARKYDTTDFKLTDYLDLYSKFLPKNKKVTAIINNGKISTISPIVDNIQNLNDYEQYQLVREDITSQQTTGNNQLMHDENNFGNLLKNLIY